MKISLAGPSYTLRSVVAAAQQSMNLYPETLAVGDEPRKQILFGRPGLKYFAGVDPPDVRCLWAGNGRMFCIHGNKMSEIHEVGSVTTYAQSISATLGPPGPAQIFSNGHQLMIVSGGYVYCDTGSGPEPVHYTEYGLLTSNGSPFVAWVSSGTTPETSALFNPAMVGKVIRIGDTDYDVVLVTTDGLGMEVGENVPTQTAIQWSVPRSGAFVLASTGGFLDGYGIINLPRDAPGPGLRDRPRVRGRSGAESSPDAGRQFQISGLNDFTLWDPLDFGVKEGHADNIRSILCDHEELWLFGDETTEVWTNVGDPNFPFQRAPGAYVHEGCVATYSPAAGNGVCWLGGGAHGTTVAYIANGFTPQRISTHAQEDSWNAPGFAISDAVSYFYQDGGHLFWVINFWGQKVTWVYDVGEGLWHERASLNPSTQTFDRYQAWFHTFVPQWGTGGKHFVADPTNGQIYEQSLNFFNDEGYPIQYMRCFPHLLNEDKNLFHHRFELFMETGIPGAFAPYALTVGLDWSEDRGRTFTQHTVLQTAGADGEYNKRIVWRRLGRARDRVYRIGVQGTSKVVLTDAFLEVTPGES